jgi:hypothetical protein
MAAVVEQIHICYFNLHLRVHYKNVFSTLASISHKRVWVSGGDWEEERLEEEDFLE